MLCCFGGWILWLLTGVGRENNFSAERFLKIGSCIGPGMSFDMNTFNWMSQALTELWLEASRLQKEVSRLREIEEKFAKICDTLPCDVEDLLEE